MQDEYESQSEWRQDMTASEATDEQAALISESTEELLSLLESNGYVVSNPYGDKIHSERNNRGS